MAGNAILGGMFDLFGAGMQQMYTRQNMQQQHQYDMEMQQLQAQLNRDQYDYERMQESPANERRRLEAAGLNPAMMYGSSGQSSGMSASVGSVSAPSHAGPAGSRPSSNALAVGMQVDAQKRLRDAEEQAKLAEAEERTWKARREEFALTFLDPLKQTIAEFDAQKAGTESERAWIAKQSEDLALQLQKALYDTNVKTAMANLSEIYARIAKLEAEEKKIGADTSLSRALKDQAEKQAGYYETQDDLAERRYLLWQRVGIDPDKVSTNGMFGAAMLLFQLTENALQNMLNTLEETGHLEELLGFLGDSPKEIKSKAIEVWKDVQKTLNDPKFANRFGPKKGYPNPYADLGASMQIK